MAYNPIIKRLENHPDFHNVGKPRNNENSNSSNKNKVRVELRMAAKKAGPVVTDNGNFVLDADFGVVEDPQSLADKLAKIPGIVEHGLFVDMAEKAYFGQKDGSVLVVDKQGNQRTIKKP